MDLRTSKILHLCLEIEQACADIYIYYKDRFKEDPAMHALWHKTAHEEINHANAIRLALACRDMDCREKNRDIHRYESAKDRVVKILNHVRSTPPSAEEALRSAIRLEKNLNEFHVSCVLDFEDPSAKKLFQSLLDGDKGHIEALEDAYRNIVIDRIETLHVQL